MAETDQTGKITKAYGFNPQSGQWSTDPLWQANAANGSLTDASSSYAYLHTDHLGTPMLVTDKRGSLVWKAVAEAFGTTEVLPETSITMNLRFSGQYFDSESGTHYNFFRDYAANKGRYIQADPIGIEGGVNFFVYAEGKPLGFIDPDGLARKWPPNGGRCATPECAAGLPPVKQPNPNEQCRVHCNLKYQLICSGIGVGVGIRVPPAGFAANLSCAITKYYVCKKTCNEKCPP